MVRPRRPEGLRRADRLTAMNWGLLPEPVRVRLADYFKQEGVADPSDVDVLLALLRINTPESLRCAEDACGLRITRCPSGIPPWPPKPVRREAAQPQVGWKATPNPCQPGTEMHDRFERVRIGMDEEKLTRLGFSRRDIRYLAEKGRIRWSQ